MDTCCIDKRSSAELSEAINAMYRWYQNAGVCVVYLSDVWTLSDLPDSKWFTPGWTLQELLAPEKVQFYNREWSRLGDRTGLAVDIARITNIKYRALVLATPEAPFGREFDIQTASVATKMSWAASRRTSRDEDLAYCLLGLFGMNMPLLYGEGGYAAFERLQKEILIQSDDESTFAWMQPPASYAGSMLAQSPEMFLDSQGIYRLNDRDEHHQILANRKPYRITNKGLQMQVHLLQLTRLDNQYCILINCKMAMPLESGLPPVVHIHRNDDKNVLGHTYVEFYYRISAPEMVTEAEWEQMLADPVSGQSRRLEDIPTRKIYLQISKLYD